MSGNGLSWSSDLDKISMRRDHLFSLVVLFNMDDGEDFSGQRPALVTSDARKQSPGNIYFLFFLCSVLIIARLIQLGSVLL